MRMLRNVNAGALAVQIAFAAVAGTAAAGIAVTAVLAWYTGAGLQSVVLGLAVSLGAALVLGTVLRRRAERWTALLDRLSSAMRRSTEGEPEVRAPLAGPPEVRELAEAFNTMMAELERRETELARTRDDAIELARVKSEFAASVSHELRTPLNGILGMLELLGRYDMPAEQREHLHVAQISGERLLALVNNILDFSRVDAGKLELPEATFDLRESVEQALELLASDASDKGLDLGYRLDPRVPARLHGKVIGLERILTNLLGNALKFTDRGEVGVEVVAVSVEDGSARLRFNVFDTGVGIAPGAQERIFDSFGRVDSSSTREYAGTGLGLAITRRLVGELGGEIGVESEPGHGSNFWVELTMTVAEEAVPKDSSEERLNGIRVLLAHPDGITRRNIEQLISDWGGLCRTVGRGDRALEELRGGAERGEPYDAVLAAEQLTDLSAGELWEAITADAAIAELRLIRVTDPGVRTSHAPARMWGHAQLSKPVRAAELRDSLLGDRVGAGGETPERAETALTTETFDGDVLIAEDNDTNREVARAMVESLGCRATIAVDGAEAVTLFERNGYDLVLMDCSMPVMDGFEAAVRIRDTESGAAVPIVALTANALEGDAERCFEVGMDDYLVKPLGRERLRACLGYWLGYARAGAGHGAPEADAPDGGPAV